jgi:hypothetical protein
MLLLEMWLCGGCRHTTVQCYNVQCSEKKQQQKQQSELSADERRLTQIDNQSVSPVDDSQRNASPTTRKILQPQFVAAIVLLAATSSGVKYGGSSDRRFQLPNHSASFLCKLVNGRAGRRPWSMRFQDALNFSDYTIINYLNAANRLVNFYVAYYQDQTKGESTHSPETCLPGSGCISRRLE